MTETAGLGSNVSFDDDEVLAGILHRKKLSASNEKLLEQLIGKKAAQARKKSQEAGKRMSANKHASPKPLSDRPKQQQEDVGSESDEEAGRAAAFKSRRRARTVEHQQSHVNALNGTNHEDDIGEHSPGEEAAVTSFAKGKRAALSVDSDMEERAAKRKPTSYLDEVLAQKAKKSKKKKKHTLDPVS